jgi:hypothetical protein
MRTTVEPIETIQYCSICGFRIDQNRDIAQRCNVCERVICGNCIANVMDNTICKECYTIYGKERLFVSTIEKHKFRMDE